MFKEEKTEMDKVTEEEEESWIYKQWLCTCDSPGCLQDFERNIFQTQIKQGLKGLLWAIASACNARGTLKAEKDFR